jgi:arylsulfatase A-like enzyme
LAALRIPRIPNIENRAEPWARLTDLGELDPIMLRGHHCPKSLVLALLVACFATPIAWGQDDRKPNIVVILVDDMGFGDPGCFNQDSKIPTPHIDGLARDGMRFTDAHAPGALCHPSRYGLLTGRHPFRTDVSVWRKKPVIEAGQATIASVVKSQGYRTAMVGKWHLGFAEDGYDKALPGGPVDVGFDSFFGIRASTDIPPYFYIRGDRAVAPPSDHISANSSEGWSPIQGAFWRAGGIAPDLELAGVLPRFTAEAVDVINTHAGSDEPLLLYLAYPAPHTPWLPSAEFIGSSGAGSYGDFLVMVDAMVGRVLKALDAAGMAENTLLVFSSDNGPVWYDTDVARFGHDSSGGLRGMKGDAWEGGHRMPFIVRWPGKVQPSSVSQQTICFTDLLATFAAASGAPLPSGKSDSFNILPVLLGEQPAHEPIRGPLVIPSGNGAFSIRSGPWKLIDRLGSGGFTKPKRITPGPDGPTGQLYNLAEDPSEAVNLYKAQPQIVKRLKAAMDRITGGEPSPHPSVEVDRSTLKGKVMVGYQGWFNCEGDGADLGWTHWAKNRRKMFAPDNVTVDLWPDVSELDAAERYATDFKNVDGSIAEVFSSGNRETVLRHFRWMRDYGIDGAFIQRFANGLSQPGNKQHKDRVLSHAREGANQFGRSFAVMYDLSGLPAGGVSIVRDDWANLQAEWKVGVDAAYQQHEGAPLVAIWGVGFTKGRKYGLGECLELVQWLKSEGCAVMLGVPSFWREGVRDATSDPILHSILKLADIVSPWSVGRYRTPEQATIHAANVWQADRAWCLEHGLDFLPVAFPGFSWKNLHGGELDAIPRLKGEFLWSQVVGAQRAECDMLYIAMFDEVDEGTAIFKCTNTPPVGAPFLTYEDLPSDHYLRLVGYSGSMLKGRVPFQETMPTLTSAKPHTQRK